MGNEIYGLVAVCEVSGSGFPIDGVVWLCDIDPNDSDECRWRAHTLDKRIIYNWASRRCFSEFRAKVIPPLSDEFVNVRGTQVEMERLAQEYRLAQAYLLRDLPDDPRIAVDM